MDSNNDDNPNEIVIISVYVSVFYIVDDLSYKNHNAPNGNRTRVNSLEGSHSATELQVQPNDITLGCSC